MGSITYDVRLESCPVCRATELIHQALRSTAGFMSVPGVDHSRCRMCGSYFVNPRPSDDSLETFYRSQETEDFVEDNILHRSLDRYFDAQAREYFIDHRLRPLQRHVGPGGSVLDIGCGAGVFVRFMKDAGFRAHGIDISTRSISVGRDKLELGEDIGVGHWSSLDGAYDVVTAWTLIEHLKDPEGLLRKSAALLGPRGVLLVEFPTVDSLLFRHLTSHFFWVMPYYHLFLFSRRGMRVMLDRCGFDVLEEYDMPRNWYFFASVCRSLGVDPDTGSLPPPWSEVAKRIDQIFDDIALEQGASSTVQFIARRR